MLESGLMYTVSVLILFGTYLASNNAQLGVSDSVRPTTPYFLSYAFTH